MTTVRSTATARRARRAAREDAAESRWRESLLLALSTAVVVAGLWLVYQAKTARPTPFAEAESMLAEKRLLNLNRAPSVEELLPLLTAFDNADDRKFAAEKIHSYVQEAGEVPNVGVLAKLRVGEKEIDERPRLDAFSRELQRVRQAGAARRALTAAHPEDLRVPLLRQLGELKLALVVRTPVEFRREFLLWSMLYVLAFYLVHAVWRVRRFRGDGLLLPLLHLLTGLGLILMVSLRDPLRDTLSFVNYAQGVAAGCVVLLGASLLDVQQRFGWSRYVPLALGALLSLALVIFGSGPGASDAKVNLLGFQPVEVIKILVVLFLAGYFAREWEVLRELKQKIPRLPRLLRGADLPRLDYVLPVAVGVGLMMCFFFLQKDLGPALVLSCIFLALYGVARNRAALAASGLSVMAACFYVGYRFSLLKTVEDRINIWLSPWDNFVPGGEQVVQALWGLAAGGVDGTGLGLGDPSLVPAIHTDLILAAVGEELGYVGLLTVCALYAVLIHRSVRIALRAPSHYTFFLALGLTLLTGFQVLLISLGTLGLVPLSGVVSPFLSYGRSAMLANFAIYGILLAISARADDGERPEFQRPVKCVMAIMGLLALAAVCKAAYVQVLRADETVARSTLAMQADGTRRFQYNPRLLQVARLIPRGSIYDSRGIPLATSDWQELEQWRSTYESLLGGKLEDFCARHESRYYPFGPYTFHLLGDARTRVNWAASNTSFVERDLITRLQGFDDYVEPVRLVDPSTGKVSVALRRDYRELIPLLRYRYRPEHVAVRNIIDRRRDVRTSIDIRLQIRAAAILGEQVRAAHREKGAAVVLDAQTGDLLASVSYPMPEDTRLTRDSPESDAAADDEEERLLDRARFGLYPPGSTFKIVTATAALRRGGDAEHESFECVGLGGGRVGNFVRGWGAPIRDDEGDRAHGAIQMERAIAVSCNAYFAQLGTYSVGAEALLRTAELYGISVARPNTAKQLADALPQAAYGQGQVTASPFQMARVAATVANGGRMPLGRWVVEDGNDQAQEPRPILAREQAEFLGRAMRLVVTEGTGNRLKNVLPPIAGKTGTAEVEGQDSHSWFIGFAPYGTGATGRIAFSIIIENGGYGGRAAVPAAGSLVAAARSLGIIK